jgi:Na+-transporting NADH:ubiquinone oxidoreductase subunit A
MTDNVRKIRIKRGLDLAIPGVPEQRVCDGPVIRSIALQGHDYPGVRPLFSVQVGESVSRGQVLFSDRKRPAIQFTAPVSGTVSAIDRGHRRRFASLQLRVAGDDAVTFKTLEDTPQGSEVRELLLASGLWSSFRARPFGNMPDDDAVACAIFVTALESDPLAADASVVIADHAEHFRKGVRWLAELTDGTVFVCQGGGTPLVDVGMTRTVTVMFDGPHPAGLPGTHIHYLAPASRERPVWHIGYQDVIAIGHLAHTGQLWGERIVALAGPGVSVPALYRTLPGANLQDLISGEQPGGSQPKRSPRILSGSPLSGRECPYLCRFHNQVSVLQAPAPVASDSFWRRWWRTNERGIAGPIIPHEALESVLPFDIFPVPLMRALSAGDVEAAQRLGCLQLVEEDVALLSYLCTSGADYGDLLRGALNELEQGA